MGDLPSQLASPETVLCLVAALFLVLLLVFAEHGLGQVPTLLLFLLLVIAEEGLGEVAALLLFLLLVVTGERRSAERHQQCSRHHRQHHLLHTDSPPVRFEITNDRRMFGKAKSLPHTPTDLNCCFFGHVIHRAS